jgi:ligand-binding sensor domain-containing protein
MGVARHTGQNTMDNWTVFTINDGLINNFVQAIAVDNDGKIWFGTQGGISVFDGENWKSYSKNDGLISNNVLCITVDKSNIVWIGTDNGVSSLGGSEFVNYQ